MKKINIVIDHSKIIYYHIYPILVNKKELERNGIKLEFHDKLSEKLFDCDILVLLSKPIFTLIDEKKYIFDKNGLMISFLRKAREKVRNIIWMDTADSTSSTHFELLPYVDKYLKKQLFKDRCIYEKQFYGGRIFTDFYHHNYDISDSETYSEISKLLPDFNDKIGLSWNIGLGDMFSAFGNNRKSIVSGRYFNILKPKYNQSHFNIDNKDIDILLKTTANLSRETVAFHRKELVNQLIRISKKNKLFSVIQGKRISDKEFKQVMKRTKIFPSPFGWGEIGVRDYESFIYGGVLLKPSLEHMLTWPNIFIEGETYVSFNWDYSDLEEKIQGLLADKNYMDFVALNGQKAYLKSISPEGMRKFCERFIDIVVN
jgi:hypothetical protein